MNGLAPAVPCFALLLRIDPPQGNLHGAYLSTHSIATESAIPLKIPLPSIKEAYALSTSTVAGSPQTLTGINGDHIVD
jgi:hypothetical protein